MPIDTNQAVSGKLYVGVFEVDVGRAGTLADFKLEGDGWSIRSFRAPDAPTLTDVGVLRVPFQGVPQDADRPIRLSFTYDGRRVSRAYEVGPKYFSRVGKSGRLRHLEGEQTELIARSVPTDKDEGQAATRGGAIELQFSGRFVYTRPCRDLRDPSTGDPPDGDCDDPWDVPARTVGADNIWVEVMDDDGLASDDLVDESIWSHRTDVNGFFNSPVISWDDCDAVGCDDPDIYVRFECDTGVGQVQDPGIKERDYSWWTMDNIIEDFTGREVRFGTMSPSDNAQMPAVHIWNSLVRTHRYIGNVTGIDVDHVDIQWPEGETGASYIPEFDEIYIGVDREWREDTHTHEYGHHFMNNYSVYQSSDYCNGYCDGEEACTSGTDCENDGHCPWCMENRHDAWNEGWPNWLADVVTRSYSVDYEFEDCTPYTPLFTRSAETITRCCQDDLWHDPWITEGFVAALLRDIDDQRDDAHDPDDDDNWAWSDTTDCMALGSAEIFAVVTQDQPHNVAEFITMFLSRYPQHTAGLWQTAQNVDPDYIVGNFPSDTAPPGAITGLHSPTHPSGVGGALPCITVEWEPPQDDVTGIYAHSIAWSTDPGVVADTTIEWIDTCVTQTAGPPRDFGQYYVSIRAVDWANHWGPPATFGPFVINQDCNNNGIMDICDVACDASGFSGDPLRTQCDIPADFCDVPGCGTTQDCNDNLVPDDCDLANGTSKDCDKNGIPDECDGEAGWLIHWADGNGSWHNPNNWFKLSECPTPPPPPTCDYTFPTSCPATPDLLDNVCIDNAYDDITVIYANGQTAVNVLACYENLNIAGGSSPWASLSLARRSWVNGDLSLSGNNSVLQVLDRLDIEGVFNWTGSNVSNSAKLKGSGITHANGGVQISEIVHLDGHRLILDGNSASVSTTGRVDFISPSVFEIRPGSTYEHQGSTGILNGWFDDSFVNGGTLIKSVDTGASSIYMFTNNSGLIHVKAGTLKLSLGGLSTGDFVADPGTTLEFVGGNRDFLAGSSIVAQDVAFTGGGAGTNNVWGTYNVSGSTSVTGTHTLTFHSSANIVDYGDNLYVCGGPVYFEPVLGETIHFDGITVTCNNIYFNSGDPIEVQTLAVGPGLIRGPSDITVSGLLTWNAAGAFMGPSTVHANGGMLIGAGGGAKTLYDRVVNNAGTATFLGGFGMSGASVFNNLSGGVMDIQVDGGIVSFGTVNNAGTIVKSSGVGTSTISAFTTNTGTVEVQVGVLEFYTHYGLFYTQTAGRTVLNGGDLNMFGPAPVQIDGGALTGVGVITGNVVNAGGAVEPGASLGQIDIVGAYTQGPAGSLKAELGGSMVGEFDVVACTAGASLAGDLDVTLIGNFEPNHCDSFPILTAGSITGQFDNVNVTNLPAGMELQVDYSATAVTIIAFGPPSDGDCNGDCHWDADDFAHFVQCMAGPGGGLGPNCDCADLDHDQDVDMVDLAELQSRFTGAGD